MSLLFWEINKQSLPGLSYWKIPVAEENKFWGNGNINTVAESQEGSRSSMNYIEYGWKSHWERLGDLLLDDSDGILYIHRVRYFDTEKDLDSILGG